jgi:hypothetical protein
MRATCFRRSKPPAVVADSHAEQGPEGECLRAAIAFFGRVVACGDSVLWWLSWWTQRQEGTGAGDGVRLRERSKALKGEPQERIWSETWPAGSVTVKRQEVEKT